mgnify:CR=1 FL=1
MANSLRTFFLAVHLLICLIIIISIIIVVCIVVVIVVDFINTSISIRIIRIFVCGVGLFGIGIFV